MLRRSKLPSRERILHYWGIDCDDACMACGFTFYTERCHIVPVCEGGSDELNNLTILCPNCHKESEHLSGHLYWAWHASKAIESKYFIRNLQSLAFYYNVVRLLEYHLIKNSVSYFELQAYWLCGAANVALDMLNNSIYDENIHTLFAENEDITVDFIESVWRQECPIFVNR